MNKHSRGFTLIELLIVIGLLGILATGLLAAVDPFEQLKKGRDTNMRNIVVEYYNAAIRYYATHGELPWCPAGTCDVNISAAGGSALSAITAYTDSMIADGELKTDFTAAVGGSAANIHVMSPDTVSVYVCFRPESKSLRGDASTRYDANGAIDDTNCGPAVVLATKQNNSCFWCAK